MIEIISLPIPKSNKRTRPGRKLKPTSITVHETANTNVRANARAHALLQQNGNPRQASWHFTVDDEKEVYQSIPVNEVSYHAGTRSGNHTSISIEICVNHDGNYLKAVDHAISLIKYLQLRHPSIKRILPHHHWSRKNCPRYLRAGTKGITWPTFEREVTKRIPTLLKAKPYRQTKKLRVGSKVTLLKSATHYATGEPIPSWVKNKSYTVMQTSSNRVLLKEIYSWVRIKDIKIT